MYSPSKYQHRARSRAGSSATKPSLGGSSHQDYRAFKSFLAGNHLHHHHHSSAQSDPSHPSRPQHTNHPAYLQPGAGASLTAYNQTVWGNDPNQQMGPALENVNPGYYDQSNVNAPVEAPEYPQTIDPSTIMLPDLGLNETYPYDPRFQTLPHSYRAADYQALPTQPAGSVEENTAYVQSNCRTTLSQKLDHEYMSNLLHRPATGSQEVTAQMALLNPYYPGLEASRTSALKGFDVSESATPDFSSSGYSYEMTDVERLRRNFVPDNVESSHLAQQVDSTEHEVQRRHWSPRKDVGIYVQGSTPGPHSGARNLQVTHAAVSQPQDDSRLRPFPRRHSEVSSSASTTSDISPGSTLCPVCKIKFTGRYAKGNRARHVRQKHKDKVVTYTCEDENCDRVFLRQDARLKHHRRAHKHLQAGAAVPRGSHASRRSNDDVASPQSNVDDNTGDPQSFYVNGHDYQNNETSSAAPLWSLHGPAQVEQELRYMRFG